MDWYRHFYTKEFIELVGFASAEQTRTEANFVKHALSLAAGSKVLDLCCGYGRHTKALADSTDWEITGLDLSDDYLAVARAQFSAPNVEYHHGDMRDVPFENHFDAVINLFTSFGFFESDEENEQVLRQVHRALKPRGVFLLDYENKIHFISNDVKKKRRDWKVGEDGQCYLFENEYDVLNEREIFKVSVIENGRLKEVTGYNIRLYGFPEIKRMLSENGFGVVSVWGDYDGSAYSVESRRLITLSRKLA
jgi:ubiquinone/menaquinone biosynthesis C-methylase UbiE